MPARTHSRTQLPANILHTSVLIQMSLKTRKQPKKSALHWIQTAGSLFFSQDQAGILRQDVSDKERLG